MLRRLLHLASEIHGGRDNKVWIRSTDFDFGIEAFEIDLRCRHALLPNLHTFAQTGDLCLEISGGKGIKTPEDKRWLKNMNKWRHWGSGNMRTSSALSSSSFWRIEASCSLEKSQCRRCVDSQ